MVKLEIFKDFLIGLIIVAILSTFFWIALPSILNTDTPIAYISSSSMEPSYYVGDLVIIKGVSGKDIKIGDIIVFQPKNYPKLILHRVVAKKYENGKYYFLTKGDNPRTNPYPDGDYFGWIPEERVKGKLIARIPYIGYLFIFLSSIFGKALFLTVLVMLTIYMFISEEEDKKTIKISKKIGPFSIRAIILIAFIFSITTGILLTNYLYLGEGEAKVSVVSIDGPYQQLNFRVYQIVLKIDSYGLIRGSIREVTLFVNSVNKTIFYSCVWKIDYIFVGSKKIGLPILLNLNTPKQYYNIIIVFRIEKLNGASLKTIELKNIKL